MMTAMADLLARIHETLMTDWDPIGVRDTDCPRDEYNHYAYQVWSRLVGGGSAMEIASYLNGVVVGRMNLEPDYQETEVVAQKLAALRDRVVTVWEGMSPKDCEVMWKKVKQVMGFRPSTQSSEWPGILEPRGSVTFKLAGPSVSVVDDLNARALSAFRSLCPEGRRIAALDWEHSCYWFDPHREVETWEIDLYPNGDYYMFLASDLAWGTFGHPWEGTLCVWGEKLMSSLRYQDAPGLAGIVRRGCTDAHD